MAYISIAVIYALSSTLKNDAQVTDSFTSLSNESENSGKVKESRAASEIALFPLQDLLSSFTKGVKSVLTIA